jgi:large subunit ribosomal protein L6
MSRLAKKPIQLPTGVSASFSSGAITLQGPKGTLSQAVHSTVQVTIDAGAITLSSNATERSDYAQWGLTYALIRTMI